MKTPCSAGAKGYFSIGPFAKGIASVHINDYEAMHSVATHILENSKGRQIALMRGLKNSHITEVRERAFRDAFAAYSRPVDESLILDGHYSVARSYHALETYLKREGK